MDALHYKRISGSAISVLPLTAISGFSAEAQGSLELQLEVAITSSIFGVVSTDWIHMAYTYRASRRTR